MTRFALHIPTRYVVAITVAVTVLMIASAVIELHQSRQELAHVLEEEALSLADAVALSSTNNLLAMGEIEDLLTERLLNNAFFIARLDSIGSLRASDLATIARENHIFRINVFNARGERVLTSHTMDEEHESLPPRYSPSEFLAPLLHGDADRLVIGLKGARFGEGQRYAVAVRRTARGGGAIALNLDADDLLAFRRSIGIGRLISDLGDNSGLEYVVLQDRQGIIAASRSVSELGAIDADRALQRVMQDGTVLTREVPFDGRQTLEVVRAFDSSEAPEALIRVGVSMDEMRATEARMQRRVIIISAVLLVLGALVVLLIVAMQNARLFERQYGAMRTFTGNILAQMQDAVVTLDKEGRVTMFNAEAGKLFGVSSRDTVGHAPGADIAQVFAPDVPFKEMILQLSGPSPREIAVALTTTFLPDGSRESVTALIRDMTEARQLQRAVQRSDKLSAMGKLASGVAHEIRNPLNAITMIAQRLAAEFSPKKGLREYRSLTRVLGTEAQRVNGIIRQFLEFARPPHVDPHDTNPDELIGQIGEVFASQASEKGVKFTTTKGNHGNATLDSMQITQAVQNLLMNALDATPPGGLITLATGSSGGSLTIAVGDTGEGIPADRIDRIFDLYYSTKESGTGLGLAIVQQIVAAHNGRIDVASTEGRGSRFTILIPPGESGK